MDTVAMAVLIAVSGLTSLAMLLAAIRYLALGPEQKAALRSDPQQFFGLSKGEEALRWIAVLGLAIGLFTQPWWPRRGPDLSVSPTDVPSLVSWGAIAWLGVLAVLVRRLIYKRWI